MIYLWNATACSEESEFFVCRLRSSINPKFDSRWSRTDYSKKYNKHFSEDLRQEGYDRSNY